MAQVFKPKKTIFVPATGGHPPNTEYRVAWGTEKWGNNEVYVTKVQMVYNGAVAGMLSPSFPDNTLDLKAVEYAITLLPSISEGNTKKFVCLLKEVSEITEELTTNIENEVDNMTTEVFASKRKPVMVMTDVELADSVELTAGVYGFLVSVQVYVSN